MDKPTPPQNPPGLEIMRVGKHVSDDGRTFEFTDADLQAIADSYEPTLSEAPLVVGHPKNDDPAYGWAVALKVQNGSLFAEPHQVEPTFAEAVNQGRYKRISSSIYLPDTPGNPKPGKFYLKHIGLHGAGAVSMKGMRPASFSEVAGDGPPSACFSMPLSNLGWSVADLFQRVRDWMIDKDGVEAADRILPQWQIRSIEESTRERAATENPLNYAAPAGAVIPETSMTQQQQQSAADFAEREQALATQHADLARREQAIADREAAARRDEAAAFTEQLVNDGKLLPRNKPAVIALLLAQPASAPLNFAEGEGTVTKPAADVLRELLSGLPKAIDFGEKSAGESGDGANAAANFAAPAGAVVSADRLELHRKALAYQASHPGTEYAAAVAAVGG